MSRPKDVLTTGEVAKICNVAPRTVSKWFDSGQLQGYRIPGSKDRRIPVNALVRFMKQHHIPLDGLRTGQTRVLVVDQELELIQTVQKVLGEQATYDVRTVNSGFGAGIESEKFRPHVLFLDIHLGDIDPLEVCRAIRQNTDLELTKIIAMSGKLTDGQANQLLTQGFDGYLKKPFQIRQLVEIIEDSTALVY